MYGLSKRIVAVEGSLELLKQFQQLYQYIINLIKKSAAIHSNENIELSTASVIVNNDSENNITSESLQTPPPQSNEMNNLADCKRNLDLFLVNTYQYINDLRKPIYMCVTGRIIDIQNILLLMSKIKWDINHVTVQHSSYIDVVNRVSVICFNNFQCF